MVKDIKGEFMEETLIVVMLKENETGLFSKELFTLSIDNNEQYLLNISGCENNDVLTLEILVTTDREVCDWEFDAIYDCYETSAFDDVPSVLEVTEVDDVFNPTWKIVFKYDENEGVVEKTVNQILECHKNELEEVYKSIKDLEEEYK